MPRRGAKRCKRTKSRRVRHASPCRSVKRSVTSNDPDGTGHASTIMLNCLCHPAANIRLVRGE